MPKKTNNHKLRHPLALCIYVHSDPMPATKNVRDPKHQPNTVQPIDEDQQQQIIDEVRKTGERQHMLLKIMFGGLQLFAMGLIWLLHTRGYHGLRLATLAVGASGLYTLVPNRFAGCLRYAPLGCALLSLSVLGYVALYELEDRRLLAACTVLVLICSGGSHWFTIEHRKLQQQAAELEALKYKYKAV